MQVLSSKAGDTVVLRVTGRLDGNTAPAFDDECTRAIAEDQKRAVLDCESLEYISSAGLRSILALAKTLQGRGGSLAVCGLKGIVAEVFEISGFSNMLPVFGDVEEALAAGKD
jgi:anti-anti-sigma factor